MTVKFFIDFNSKKFGVGAFHERLALTSDFKHKLFISLLWFELGVKL
jgi:hypothetical protein